jgi:hypothetical protein
MLSLYFNSNTNAPHLALPTIVMLNPEKAKKKK